MKKNGFNTMLLITLATFGGKLLGIIRDMLISYHYGTTQLTDAFFLALSIPTMILGIFTASTDSAVIPQYIRIKTKMTQKDADRNFSSIINTLLIIAIAVCVIIFIFPHFFVEIFAGGFKKSSILIAAKFLRIFAPIGVLHMLYCFFCTYNAAYGKNTARTILAFFPNLLLVFSLCFFYDEDLIYLSITYVLANVFCVLLPMLEMRKIRYIHYWKIDYKSTEYKHFWTLFIPIMGGAVLADVQQYVDKYLGSSIIGGISYLNYGNKLINIFDSILVVGMGVVLLPMLSRTENKKDNREFSIIASKVTRYLLEILIPCLTFVFGLAIELITVLFGRGKFDDNSIYIVSMVLRAYSPLIIFMPLTAIFSKFFQAKEMNKIPFKVNCVSVMINLFLSIVLKKYCGVVGIALATTIAMIVEVVMYVYLINKKIGWNIYELNLRVLIKLIIPSILSIITGRFVQLLIKFSVAKIVVEGIVIVAFFVGWYYIFLKEDFLFWIKKLKV